jgi:ribosomal protein S18 acetylase RimI-like enzyme
LNGALKTSTELAADKVFNTCQEFFGTLGYGFVMWIRDHADSALEKLLKSRGLSPVEDPGGPAMFTPHRLDMNQVPPGIEICRVSSAQDMLDYASITATAFQISLALAKIAVAQVAVSSDSKVAAFVARERGKPLAGAMTFVEGRTAGIYYVGTIPEARGRGLGGLCTRAATNAGFDLGATVAVLQASQTGQSFYERIGYQAFTRYRWYPVITQSGAVRL